MPELPEVETIRKQLAQRIIGKRLGNQTINDVKRRGKIIILKFSGGDSLVFHLKLTGQLLFNAQPSLYTREVFKFNDGSNLIFNDARRFGWWKKIKNVNGMKEIKQLGPEALEIKEKEFIARLLQRKKAKIKPLLMDQRFLAGIGNIYADEILFDVKIKPSRLAGGLLEKEKMTLFLSIKKILKKAIGKRGSSVKDYIDVLGKRGEYQFCHKVYQRTGQPCKECGTAIKHLVINGRSAHYCPKCQL